MPFSSPTASPITEADSPESHLPLLRPGGFVADRYMIEQPLGMGGMACVWLAYDQILQRSCALKVLDAQQAASPDAVRRFQREARVTARIRSSCVVNIFDHGEWQGLPYIAMEYLDGEDLASRIAREGKLDPQTTCELVTKVARGLAHAHSSGVVHRDIKPENIFLVANDEGEEVKLLDFGIATRVTRVAPVDAQDRIFLGTPMYASPEQLSAHGVDFRTDLWSLGVVVFECLTGHAPFTGSSLEELCSLIITQPLPRLADYDAELPLALDAWLLRALARDREQRFQTAKELAEALSAATGCARLSIPSLLPRPEQHSESGELFVHTASVASPAALPARRSWLPRVSRAALAIGLLLGVATAVVYQRGRAPTERPLQMATTHAVSVPSAERASAKAPDVTVSAVGESLAATCTLPTPPPPPATNVADEPAPRKNRPRSGAKPSPATPQTLEAWRMQPGF